MGAQEQFGEIRKRHMKQEISGELLKVRTCTARPYLMSYSQQALFKLDYISDVWEYILNFQNAFNSRKIRHVKIDNYLYLMEAKPKMATGKMVVSL